MKEPNREPALGQGALHTIEHLAATFLRNHPVWSDKIVYWGPMGCLTGNYLLMKGDLQSEDIVELMKETFRFIAEYEGEVPGATPRDCGNYLLQDLPIYIIRRRKVEPCGGRDGNPLRRSGRWIFFQELEGDGFARSHPLF